MSWAERLVRLTTGDATAEENAALLQLLHAFGDRSVQLAAHAELAPNAAAERDLHQLAHAQAELADEVQRTLEARQVPIPAAPSRADAGGGRNHWARLVEDLEAMRLTRAWLLGEGARTVEADPQLAPLFQSLTRGLDRHLGVLRALIARADAQALD